MLYDQVYPNNTFWQRLNKRGRVTEKSHIEHHILAQVAKPNNMKWLTHGYDILNTEPDDVARTFSIQWADAGGTVTVSEKDLVELGDDGEVVVPFVETKIEQRMMEAVDFISIALWEDGSTPGSFEGLQLGVDDTTVANDWSGIDLSVVTALKANVDVATTKYSYSTLLNQRLNSTFGGYSPSIYVTTRNLWQVIASMIVPGQEINPSADDLEYGGDLVIVDRTPVIWDDYVTASHLYGINEDHLSLHVHNRHNFALDEFIKPGDQQAYTAQLSWFGYIIIRTPRTNFKFTALAG